MESLIRRAVYGLLVSGAVGIGLCVSILTALAGSAGSHQGSALQRWSSGGLERYRLAVRIEYRGDTCFQQVEVHDGAARAVRNTCDLAWLDLMSVPELFDLAHQIEDIPTARCYPSSRWCICQRVFSARQIEYDRSLGYPTVVLSRSDLQPNWTGLDFWERLVSTTSLPSCGPAPRRLTVEVLALDPMP
jgi:hypothetical protein